MKNDKSCCKYDMVVAEMVKPLLHHTGGLGVANLLSTLENALENDLLGLRGANLIEKRKLLQNDVASCLFPDAKGICMEESWKRGTAIDEHFTIEVEVPLHPKTAVVTHPKGLRPVALLPVLRNLIGGIVLAKTANLLVDTGVWQFAYTNRYQVIDLVLVVNRMGQKSMEWFLPLIIGVTDTPKCFDEVNYEFMMEALLEKGVDPNLVAWFIREVCCSY